MMVESRNLRSSKEGESLRWSGNVQKSNAVKGCELKPSRAVLDKRTKNLKGTSRWCTGGTGRSVSVTRWA